MVHKPTTPGAFQLRDLTGATTLFYSVGSVLGGAEEEQTNG